MHIVVDGLFMYSPKLYHSESRLYIVTLVQYLILKSGLKAPA